MNGRGPSCFEFFTCGRYRPRGSPLIFSTVVSVLRKRCVHFVVSHLNKLRRVRRPLRVLQAHRAQFERAYQLYLRSVGFRFVSWAGRKPSDHLTLRNALAILLIQAILREDPGWMVLIISVRITRTSGQELPCSRPDRRVCAGDFPRSHDQLIAKGPALPFRNPHAFR